MPYPEPQQTLPQFHQEYSWDIIKLIIEGSSAIDLPKLSLMNRDEAHRFLHYYGYDLDNPADKEAVQNIFSEAVSFIKTHFCSGTALHPAPLTFPREIEFINDCRDLLVWASKLDNTERQGWSCATLRVMHTIHHLTNTLRVESFQEIKRQILDRFRQNIHHENDKPILGFGPLAVPLYGVFYKEEKSRDSLIMKLLHKTKNVAENIHDRIGVKLVTENKFEVLRTLRYLVQSNIIMFANVTPGRSRNSLFTLEKYHDFYDKLNAGIDASLSGDEREARIQELLSNPDITAELFSQQAPAVDNEHNRFTSTDYQSLQFTVQQQVKLQSAGFFKARRLRVHLEKYHLGPDLDGLLNELEGPEDAKEIRVLFPFEVQIIDKDNYFKSIAGNASHDAYKKRQSDSACERVLANVFRAMDAKK